jgi:hypothetical protein
VIAFLNVLSLFNGSIPFIAIKMSAFQIRDVTTLTFTTVLDELERAFDEEDDGSEPVDRGYWESKASPKTLTEVDKILTLVRSFAPGIELRYKKHYIGFGKEGQAYLFAVNRPRRSVVSLEIRLPRSDVQDRRRQHDQSLRASRDVLKRL